MVDRQVMAEVVAHGQEGPDGHAVRPFARGAGAVEEIPGATEVLVLIHTNARASVKVQ